VASIARSTREIVKPRTPAEGVIVTAVRPGSPAARAGLGVGDRIVAVNDEPVRDAIDFRFHSGDAFLDLVVERVGGAGPGTTTRHAHALKRRGSDLGLELAAPQPGEIATCANKCVFCFVHQLPKGLRRSLYVKDDDYRLSFLHGNYITLSDLAEEDISRIVAQRLSPLYVSVHATDTTLRERLLGFPGASAEILPRLERLAKAGIRTHAQIVLCPDWNDGANLDRTVHDLAHLHPHVATTAIVPVGLTRHRARLPALRSLTAEEAGALVTTVENWQRQFSSALGSRFVFLADEIYLLGERPLPPGRAYEGFPIVEDGVGLVRRFEDGFTRALKRRRRRGRTRDSTIVTGTMFAPRLGRLLAAAGFDPARVRVAAIANELFGHSIGVAGLLTGQDIQQQLAARSDLGEVVLVPAIALRDVGGVFLDDHTPSDLERDLGVRVTVVPPSPVALLRALQDG